MTMPPVPPASLLNLPQHQARRNADVSRLAGAIAGARAGAAAAQDQTPPAPVAAGMGGLPSPGGAAPPLPGGGISLPPVGANPPPLPVAGGVAPPGAAPLIAAPLSPLPAASGPAGGPLPPGVNPPPFAAGGQVGAPAYPAHGLSMTLRPSLVGSNGEDLPDGVIGGPDLVRAFLAFAQAQAQGAPPPRVAVQEHDDTDTGHAHPALHDFLSAQVAHPDELVRDLAAAWKANPSRRAELAALAQQMRADGDQMHPDLAAALAAGR